MPMMNLFYLTVSPVFLNNKIVHEREVFVGTDQCHVRYFGSESLIQVIELE